MMSYIPEIFVRVIISFFIGMSSTLLAYYLYSLLKRRMFADWKLFREKDVVEALQKDNMKIMGENLSYMHEIEYLQRDKEILQNENLLLKERLDYANARKS